jgi:hypothetical protein
VHASLTLDVTRFDCVAKQNSKKQVFFYFRRMRLRAWRARFGGVENASSAFRANPGGTPAGKKIASGC